MNLPDYLAKNSSPSLAKVILAISSAAKDIAHKIRTANTGKAGSQNTFGEEQLALDVLSDKIFFAAMQDVKEVKIASSEEQTEEVVLNPDGEFALSFDPLDGSSLVDVNLAVGTIFGIWGNGKIVGESGKSLLSSGLAVYGPRTTLVFAIDTFPVEFTLQDDGSWLLTKEKLEISEGKMFAPGNLRACIENPNYAKLVKFWIDSEYTLRYSGGMVPDLNQILLKGKGVFSYAGSASHPPKLRLVYECAPLARLIEKAGGMSSDGSKSILENTVKHLDERITICVGSKEEVKRFEEFLRG
ncbi:MAG: fructose-bisphosphatase class I [Candidatus Gracilibacteria bacterium]|jgi:sedoheptulose-bisphosphatase